jgi:predicted GNAT family N-acyltransferase
MAGTGGDPEPIPEGELRVERFKETVRVRDFDCGNKELNDFLNTEEVANYEAEKFGKTHLVYWQTEGSLLGYFTISNESLRTEYFHSVKSFTLPSEIRLKTVPGILIGRLATDLRFQRRGVGSSILRYIAGLALASPAAARCLFLEAYPESVEFYKRFDFVVVEHQKLKHRRNRIMVFDLLLHPEWQTKP